MLRPSALAAAGGLAGLLLAVVTSGCDQSGRKGSSPDQEPSGQLAVTVGILPEAWLVEQVGGRRVRVTVLVRPGESAELYQPSDAQIRDVVRTSAYFLVGMPFENSRALDALRSSERLRFVDLRQGITLRDMVEHSHPGHSRAEGSAEEAHQQEGKDPHIWLSAGLLKIQAGTICRTLESLDPSHSREYRENLSSLEKRLDRLDEEVRARLAPYRGKAFFVFHPAWGYFADDYGLREVAIEIEGKEPSDSELTRLQRDARRQGTKVIFTQPQNVSRAAKAVAAAIGARTETLDDLAADPAQAIRQAAERIAAGFER